MKKPKLTFWQIWNMNAGFFGIQFGFALQNANVSRIFETLGAKVDDIAILWIAAPVTGLIVQPIIGHMSDRTWTRLGRRKPYFLFGAILASLALVIMPHSSVLWMAAGMLWILDASINISMEPFRAFVGDMLPDEQRTLGFSMQSFFIGLGAVIASSLPYIFKNWLHIPNTAPEGLIPPSVKWSFYTGSLVFISAVLWTVFSTKEYPPEEFEKHHQDNKTTEKIDVTKAQKRSLTIGLVSLASGVALTFFLLLINADWKVFVFAIGLIIFALLEVVNAFLIKKGKYSNGFSEIFIDLNNMPKTMRQLAVVQFFSWFALFAMWIYSTPGITEHNFDATNTTTVLYNDAADWIGILMGVYNGAAALFAFAIMWLAGKIGRKSTHSLSLLVGAISFLSIVFIQDKHSLIIPFLGIGMVWASILAMPYAILTSSLPQNKMGIYMGIFNFFIVIPQILAASLLGFTVKTLFDGHAVYAFLLGSLSFVIASVLVLFVDDPLEKIKK